MKLWHSTSNMQPDGSPRKGTALDAALRLAYALRPHPRAFLTTVVVIGGFLAAHSVGALGLSAPLAQTSTTSSTTTISYQGRLQDKSGNPVTSSGIAMQFRLYNVSSGGAPLWSETQAAVPVENGLFHVLLGSVNPIPASFISSNSTLWLGIAVGSDSEMTPREQVGSVPYAMVAQSLAGGLHSAAVLPDAQSVQIPTFQTSSSSWVDITGSTVNVTTAQPATLFISFAGNLFSVMPANSAGWANLTINVDGTDRTDLVNQNLSGWSGSVFTPNPMITPAGFTVLVPVSAGSHTVKLRVDGGNTAGSSVSSGIGYNGTASTLSVLVFAGSTGGAQARSAASAEHQQREGSTRHGSVGSQR